ncbi:MAG: dCTP deaminase [Candidatus Thermoplasmatota archaeon]|nr:dCTP deaminase [Candidatus Thermoplasmatota archaeon]
MAVLSDTDILSLIAKGSLKIEGFDEKNLTPNGYDVSIEEVWIPSSDTRTREGMARVPGGAWFVVATKEYLVLPADVIGEIWIRTSWVRKGILSSFGVIDAGFNGNLTFSAFNASQEEAGLPIGERFAQVVFSELRSPAEKTYKERSGNYFGQRGVTLEPSADQKN